jgi:hypothetical protein
MSAKDDIDDSSAPLVEHLIELRNRLIWSVCGLSGGDDPVLCRGRADPRLHADADRTGDARPGRPQSGDAIHRAAGIFLRPGADLGRRRA